MHKKYILLNKIKLNLTPKYFGVTDELKLHFS